MARDLVFGNGRFYVAMDRRGLIRELCWPVVGAPNHLAGRKIRLGVRRDNGWFSWLGDEGWEVTQWYEGEVGVTSWRGFGMCVVRRCVMADDLLFQRFSCDLDEEFLFYHAQEFQINESSIGDTCLHLERIGGFETEMVAHFKNDVAIGMIPTGLTGKIDQVACGLTGVMGLEGTWRDAEDGQLSGKPIEQGSVDSVFGIRVRSSWEVVISLGATLEDICDYQPIVLSCDLRVAWEQLGDQPIGEHEPGWLAERSLRLIQANTGEGGHVVAAIDSDIMENNRSNYAYVWMRDAVLTAEVMGGEHDLVDFVPETDSWIWQKYHPLGYRGSTWHPHVGADAFPYQMDETALMVSYKYRHGYQEHFDGWLENLVGSIREDGLPRPSWDLWEERFGVHFWTCATVAQAFFDAGDVARGGELVQAMGQHFHLVEGRIPRRVNDHIADASVLAGCLWCEPLQERFLNQAVDMIEEYLLMSTNCRGVARYEGDYYCRVREGYPGNPWVICTMWLARAYFIQGRVDDADGLLVWCEDLASKSGMLSEQYHPDTREPLSVCPLTWSHAEYLESVRLIRG
jgi:GH15 family glucan-1,4-alpha-glucosidase